MLKMNWDMAQIVVYVSHIPWASDEQFDETYDMLRKDAQAMAERLTLETKIKWTAVIVQPEI